MNYEIKINEYGDKFYYVNKKLHREDGPAIEWFDKTCSWYKNGVAHREEGPAIETVDGYKAWRIEGKLHRKDGPAIEHVNGTKEWWFNNIIYGYNNKFTNKSWERFIKTLIFS